MLFLLLLAGCDSFDPAGTFEGDSSTQIEIRTYLAQPAADGGATVQSERSQSSTSGTRVTVRRVDDGQIELDLGFCRVRADHRGEATVAEIAAGQRCNVEVAGTTESVTVLGTVGLGPGASTITLDLNGEARRDANGVPEGYYVGWIWTFSGARAPS